MVCMRVLLTTTRGAGHFGPLIPFAHAFRRAGADVLVAAPHAAHDMVRAEGLPIWMFDQAPGHERDATFAVVHELPEVARNAHVVAELFARVDGGAALPGVHEVCRRWRPDVVMSEICEFAGPVVAEALGIPSICVGISQQGPAELLAGALVPALDDLRAEMGLAPALDRDRLPDVPYFTLMPAALEDPALPPTRAAWRFREVDEDSAGARRPRWAEGDRPLVYVTFGSVAPTMDLFPGLYRAAIDALAGLPIELLVTVGRDRDPAALGPLPANVHVERWVPQREVMPHAAAMVCHGGSGSVTMGLAAGMPMAVLPLFADQPWNAERVAAIGAGIALERGPEGVAGLRDAVSKLIIDPAYRANAASVADEMGAMPPVDLAPAIVRELIEDRVIAAIV
jgi:UDP:flavonoid glycosyltransferase YjiC (YdhE family)